MVTSSPTIVFAVFTTSSKMEHPGGFEPRRRPLHFWYGIGLEDRCVGQDACKLVS